MKVHELRTPAIMLDMDVMESSIQKYQEACNKNGKQMWPMIKTHKSLEIAKMQYDAGVTGFLCGTLDECEMLCEAGYKKIMYAYPIASQQSIDRVIALTEKCDLIIRLDDIDGAKIINEAAQKIGIAVSYTIKIDCGLHRFGIPAETVAEFADALKEMAWLRFRGVSSHSGEVYASKCPSDVPIYAQKELTAISTAVKLLRQAGYEPEIVSTGSTPTYFLTVSDPNINIYHPGNYIFNDYLQLSNGSIKSENECSLTILATIISHPAKDRFICDAGAKCLGLDQGAHGNTNIVGHGKVKGHPEIVVDMLSEEVGKLKIIGETDLKVGDKIEIIPNHACSAANLTSHFITKRGDEIVGRISVDVRGSSKVSLI